MITRPLDLAARLRPAPRSLDALFFVNAGLLVLFFSLFGSKFVLAPSLGADFRVPEMKGATRDARPATHHVSVTDSGGIFAPDGKLTMDQLAGWLRDEAPKQKDPVLLVQASRAVPFSLITDIARAAKAAGFVDVRFAVEEPRPAGKG